jgi:hypothetical protein
VSAELSRRLARVAHQLPILSLPHHERWELGIAVEQAEQFSDLTVCHRQLILEAEAARERAIADRRAAATG